MEIRMRSSNKGRVAAVMLAMGLLGLIAPMFLLGGCMTPEDKAFYGRGWINPSELDEEPPPPRNFQDPTEVSPHMMGPGEY